MPSDRLKLRGARQSTLLLDGRQGTQASGVLALEPEAAPRPQQSAGGVTRLGPRLGEAAALAGALAASSWIIWRAMSPGFRRLPTIQDDARQHVVWLARFRDPELFPHDPMADYFQAVAPPGFNAIYWLLSFVAEPAAVSKLLPWVLGLVAALFTYLFVRKLHPAPVCALLATILASWYTWQYSDLASGTPRAFHFPLLAAQLWAMASGRTMLTPGLVVLGGLLYPSVGVLGVGLLATRLVRLRGRRPGLSRTRSDWLAFLAALGLLALVVLPQQARAAVYGPVVSPAEARRMEEFDEDGRSFFFADNWFRFWIVNPRSGFDLTVSDGVFGERLLYGYVGVASLLAVMLLLKRPVGVRALRPTGGILLQLLFVSLGLFLLAHLLLFKLYLPSRFVKTSVPLVLAVYAGLALGLLIQAVSARIAGRRSQALSLLLAAGIGVAVIHYPTNGSSAFVRDPNPDITAYLLKQPKDTLVAGATRDTDVVPAFARRSVVTSREFLNPYHLGFYLPMRSRTQDLVDAYYGRSRQEVLTFIEKYGVDVFLVNRDAYRAATALEPWHKQFEPFSSRIESKFRSTARFWLLDAGKDCDVANDGQVMAVPSSCLLSHP